MTRSSGADAPYWQGLADGKLLFPRCTGCDRWMWPAGHRCGSCGAVGVTWTERAMTAAIFSWTRTWHRFALTESLDLPFTSIVAEVDDCGIRLLGRLDDPDRIDPVIGEPLTGRIGTTVIRTGVGTDPIPTIIWSRLA
ncbi:hypothetical protein GCM10011529_03010 [Polymorphobacter glacialis]|uniref:ChsH2 rubredoxin-like zinc ribbon domain-containing protein n=1 Tax=Sandarakinorhabdus glacialis TaxID=1614636 RepID=A0A917E4A8_9SPHN|nr:zinc ribbon domain-containing protein [Polymorphobacter glacialis]GGE00226.1 hypothetical protein GCM10011529_03010 [Polymorphobacter glacialis]